MKTTNKATTVWEGSGKKGKGTFGTPSGVLDDAAISFGKRFEGEKGTNPEELIAAAHAGTVAGAGPVRVADQLLLRRGLADGHVGAGVGAVARSERPGIRALAHCLARAFRHGVGIEGASS